MANRFHACIVNKDASCMSASLFKPTPTILANIKLFNMCGKMRVANSDGAFMVSTTTSHGVS